MMTDLEFGRKLMIKWKFVQNDLFSLFWHDKVKGYDGLRIYDNSHAFDN